MAQKTIANNLKSSKNNASATAKTGKPLAGGLFPDAVDASSAQFTEMHTDKSEESVILEDKPLLLAAAEQAVIDSSSVVSDSGMVVADSGTVSNQQMLLAQADTSGTGGASGNAGGASLDSNPGNLIGLITLGVGTVAAGGILLYRENHDNDNDHDSTPTNGAPVITSNGGGATANIVAAENQTAVTTVTASDVDAGDGKTFSISGGADAALFAVNSSTGAITFVSAPNFEAPADAGANNVYDVQITVTDTAGLTDVQALAVTVIDVYDTVVVEQSGAWIDLNANGVRDTADTISADFLDTVAAGYVDLAANPVIIHFNDVPNGDLNLSGFGADDRIEIDAQAFIDNGHNAMNILAIPDIKTLDEFKTAGGSLSYAASSISNPYSFISNSHTIISNFVPSISATRQTGTHYRNANSASGVTTTFWVSISLNLRSNFAFTQRNLAFFSASTSASANGQLASGLPTDMPLQDMVDFVNLPGQPATVHVIVERGGAVIDIDGDGVRDNGENRLAIFAPDGNAELATNSVVIHFNDIPLNALDLTGFGTDDMIEFDIQALQGNNIFNSTATQLRLSNISTLSGTTVGVRYAFNSTPFSPVRLTVVQMPHTFTTFNWSTRSNEYALRISTMWTSINGRSSGAFAYWADAGNPLNGATNILPGYPSASTSAVLATLNSSVPHAGQIDFLWPVNVVVESDGVWIDANADGVYNLSDDGALAADFSIGGNADLDANNVTIHYNDLPTGAWVPDLTGFDGNDRVEIDIAAMRNNISVSDTVRLSNQSTRTMGGQTQFYAGVSGVSSGNTAVFISVGNLKFGHRTITPTNTGPSPLFNTYYSATGTLEGAIASNAGALADHFQQVVFVTSVI